MLVDDYLAGLNLQVHKPVHKPFANDHVLIRVFSRIVH